MPPILLQYPISPVQYLLRKLIISLFSKICYYLLMKIYCYTVNLDLDIESASDMLEMLDAEVLYSTETPDGKGEIFAKQKVEAPFVNSVKECNLDSIDWTQQWNNFEFEVGSKTLKLNPGPGFGDLSHPTTRLVLKMMTPYVKDAHVLDIGCGSGVLSLAAAALGAASVHGIDIDPAAIEHAKENAKANHLDITFGLPEEYHLRASRLVVLMNMISSEQEVALKSLPMLKDVPCEFFISGVLETEGYRRKWVLKEQLSEEGWLGLHYSK